MNGSGNIELVKGPMLKTRSRKEIAVKRLVNRIEARFFCPKHNYLIAISCNNLVHLLYEFPTIWITNKQGLGSCQQICLPKAYFDKFNY